MNPFLGRIALYSFEKICLYTGRTKLGVDFEAQSFEKDRERFEFWRTGRRMNTMDGLVSGRIELFGDGTIRTQHRFFDQSMCRIPPSQPRILRSALSIDFDLDFG